MLAPVEEFRRYRTIWLSDIHLGTPGCQAFYLLDFLRTHQADTLYLVGDILDGWQLKKGWYWPQAHNDVVQKILRAARRIFCTTSLCACGQYQPFFSCQPSRMSPTR